MILTCTNLKYVQGALPVVGEIVEDLLKRLCKMLQRATGKPFPRIKVRHYLVREQSFNGGLQKGKPGPAAKGTLIPQERNRYLRALLGAAG